MRFPFSIPLCMCVFALTFVTVLRWRPWWRGWWSRMCAGQRGSSEYCWIPDKLESCCSCRGPWKVKYLYSVCKKVDDGVVKQVLALQICSSGCSWAILWVWSSPAQRSCTGTADLLAQLEGQSLGVEMQCSVSHTCQMRLGSTRSFWNARTSETEVAYKVSLFISAQAGQNLLLMWMWGALYVHIYQRILSLWIVEL